MMVKLCCCLFTFLLICCWAVADQPLNGQHIRVVPLPQPGVVDIKRNTTGHIISLSGSISAILESLAKNLNFTFELDQTSYSMIADSPSARGPLYYLMNKQLDLILGAVLLTAPRLKLMDFPNVFKMNYFNFLMPMPFKSFYGISAVWKPFQTEVWWGLIISLVVVLVFFVGMLKESLLYPYEVLLSQGGSVHCQTLNHYLLAGSWCLGCFVLVTAYSSVLVSFVTAPVYEPLVSSINDLIRKTNVDPVFESSRAIDLVLQDAEYGVYKKLISRVNTDPRLRCKTEAQCLEKVRSGNSVYIQSAELLLDLIGREFKRTGHCDLSVLKVNFMLYQASIALDKNSLYTDIIAKELMKMEAAGLHDLWFRWSMSDPTRCLDEARARPVNPRLNLKGLVGAFVVLGFGAVLSVLGYLNEILFFHRFVVLKKP